jgi:hypothetical protein
LNVPHVKFAIWSSTDANGNVALIARDGKCDCHSNNDNDNDNDARYGLHIDLFVAPSDCYCRSPIAPAVHSARANSHQEWCMAR